MLSTASSIADARAEAAVLSSRAAADHPDFVNLDVPIRVDPLRAGMLLPYARFLWLILCAAGLVLAIACANLSTLLLARGYARAQEAAIRTSLGASRWRLVTSGAVEALAVCLAGSVVSVLALAIVHAVIVAPGPPRRPHRSGKNPARHLVEIAPTSHLTAPPRTPPHLYTRSMTIAVIGASRDRGKFGNKALRAWRDQGYDVIPIHRTAREVEGERAYASVLDYPGDIDEATVYVPADQGLKVIENVAAKGIPVVWLNPGADDPAVVARARALGLEVRVACSIIGAGASPGDY